jgi:hypothetical protein
MIDVPEGRHRGERTIHSVEGIIRYFVSATQYITNETDKSKEEKSQEFMITDKNGKPQNVLHLLSAGQFTPKEGQHFWDSHLWSNQSLQQEDPSDDALIEYGIEGLTTNKTEAYWRAAK